MEKLPENVIIFDGVCNLCNSSIDFILRHDRKSVFSFTANQHPTGKEILTHFGLPVAEVGTIFYLEKGKLYKKSTAVLRLARHLHFPYNLSFAFLIVPRFIRDAVYGLIAKNRYNWFGKRETCRLPSEEEAARFI